MSCPTLVFQRHPHDMGRPAACLTRPSATPGLSRRSSSALIALSVTSLIERVETRWRSCGGGPGRRLPGWVGSEGEASYRAERGERGRGEQDVVEPAGGAGAGGVGNRGAGGGRDHGGYPGAGAGGNGGG